MRHIISLGAGVQSSAMALMASKGLITPMPECAIFADTGCEPKFVYDWLDQLEKILPFQVYRVGTMDLYEKSLALKTGKSGKKYTKHNIPAFTLGKNSEKGMVQRQCTFDYKIQPIRRKIKSFLSKKENCIQWLGISLDEIQRMKRSSDKRIENRFPLIEMNITRQGCLKWMQENGYPIPPRSACIMCPFKSISEWKKLSKDEFKKAEEYEKRMQEMFKDVGLDSVPYLNNSRIPLADVIRIDSMTGDLFDNECDGMCGI